MRSREVGRFAAVVTVVAIVAFTSGAITASGAGAKSWADPDEGLTEEQRFEAQELSSKAFWAHYETWLADETARGNDPRTYPVAPMLATVAGPAPTLAQAVARSTRIVVGEVESVTFRTTADVVVRVKTTETLKGDVSNSIGVVLPNGLMPDPTWTKATIGEVDGMPMLYPGDVVVLFVAARPIERGLFETQAWTGTYLADGQGFQATEGNPFARSLEGLSAGDFVETVRSAVALDANTGSR